MSANQSTGIQLEIDSFGQFTEKERDQTLDVKRFTWRNANGISVEVITYGATITSIKVPDKKGKIEDIVLGYRDMQGG